MRHGFFGAGFVLLGLLVTMAFTNCAGESQGNLFANFASSCVGLDCNLAEKQTLLDIRVNHPETLWVYPWAQQINIGGDCNEGGYDKSVVTWRLSSNGLPLMNSDSRYAATLNEAYLAECVNGRFSLLVDLMDASANLRQGLDGGSGPVQHTLEVEIRGIEINEQGEEVRVQNPAITPDYVPLIPLCVASQSC
ncbi:MAG: hypothetical protein AAF202_02850 [Pseudomonadota bacterium]